MKKSNQKLDEIVKLDVSSHPRLSEYDRHVYPVVSRRAKGLSLGVNLNPDRKCNFSCVYCQVDRTVPLPKMKLDPSQINDELEEFLTELKANDNLYQGHPLKDICIAGDGEPTIVKALPEVIRNIIKIKNKFGLTDCKIVLLTNGTRTNREDLIEVFPEFFKNNGEIWFKLDAWNQESLKKINRSNVPFTSILDHLIEVGKQFPIVLQSCLFNWEEQPITDSYYNSYLELIKSLLEKDVHLKLIQLYTLARKPAELEARPWSDDVMRQLGKKLRENLSVEIEVYFEKGKE